MRTEDSTDRRKKKEAGEKAIVQLRSTTFTLKLNVEYKNRSTLNAINKKHAILLQLL